MDDTLRALVLPAVGAVVAVLVLPPREHAAQFAHVAELALDERGRVRVVRHVLLEEGIGVPPLALQHVVDESAEERDVGAGTDLHVLRGARRGAAEARIDMDDLGTRLSRAHHEAERHRVTLGEVRAHDEDAVGVRQITREGAGTTAAERRPQTGDGGRVSYARLILDPDDSRADAELLDEVVLLVVERRAAEETD